MEPKEVEKIEPLETFWASSLTCFLDEEHPKERYCIIDKVLPNGDKIKAEAKPVVQLTVEFDRVGKVKTYGLTEVSVGIPASMQCTYNPFFPSSSGIGTSEMLTCKIKKWEM
jgi:hypothetical protein